MILSSLLSPLPKAVTDGDLSTDVAGISIDSRLVESGFVFVAMPNTEASHVADAIEAGAVAVVSESATRVGESVAWIHVADAREAAGQLASTFYGDPSRKLKVAAVTGTNGKTTTSFLLNHIMRTAWRRAGLIGTLVFDDGKSQEPATHTTPSSVKVHDLMAKMIENDCRGVAMEVSSHGIDQKRIAGVHFDAAIFTNLTQDHLDYHGSLNAYFDVKKQLFAQLASQGDKRKPAAVINIDDIRGEKLAEELKSSLYVITYGMSPLADFRAKHVRVTARGTEFELSCSDKKFLVRMPLIGRFNVSNTLAAIATASSLGIRPREAVRAMAEVPQVPGRVELVGMVNGASVFVDYAHTPDALTNICTTLKGLEPARLMTVFGCGGDRDEEKRPLMAKVASELSDLVVLTSDNPRSEDPKRIIAQAGQGLQSKKYKVIVDRSEAISEAVDALEEGDILLIAGKGHEDYQEIKGERIPFDDRRVARGFMARRRDELAAEAKAERQAQEAQEALEAREEGDFRPRRDEREDFQPRRDDRDEARGAEEESSDKTEERGDEPQW